VVRKQRNHQEWNEKDRAVPPPQHHVEDAPHLDAVAEVEQQLARCSCIQFVLVPGAIVHGAE
jgi:hypothetical protein